MDENLIYIDKSSQIPLMGVDFLGIIDRGTNIIEIKPLTLCNLKCKYCFVSANDYETNFMINSDYLISKVKELVAVKGKYKLEVHIAPYGEILLYPELETLLYQLSKINGIETISMQSNGLLLSKSMIIMLKSNGLTRLNLSLNTLVEDLACYLCNCTQYNIENLLNNIYLLLDSKIDLLIAPVWFPGENDNDIEAIIQLILNLRKQGYSDRQTQIGIQKYLVYKTGRKLKKIKPKTWDYFYFQLSQLEKKYNLKLKLGPNDFGIHKRALISDFRFRKGDITKVQIISKGRWKNECIGKLNNDLGIKILLKKPLTFNKQLIGSTITAKIIKANYKDNITTALYPY